MYDINNLLTFESFKSRIEPYQVFAFYLGKDLKLNRVIQSPLRKDATPSFSLHISKKEYMYYNDWATGDWGGDITFVRKLFNLDNDYAAMAKINADMNLELIDDRGTTTIQERTHGYITPYNQDEVSKMSEMSSMTISLDQREFESEDLLYWGRFKIPVEVLKYFNVFACRRVFLGTNVVYSQGYKVFNPAYAYAFFKDEEYSFKIYQPLAEDKLRKWLSNCDFSVLQGWQQLPATGKVLMITKSLKDVMCLYTLGIPAVAVQGELMTLKPHILAALESRFEHVYLLFDFDRGGVLGTQKLRRTFPHLKFFFIQTLRTRRNGWKDISDFMEHHSYAEGLQHLRDSVRLWNK